MKIAVGNDHRGLLLKKEIMDYLKEENIEVINVGCDCEGSVDYVDYAIKLCDIITHGEADCGILVCGTGIGMSIAANKVKGIRCARVVNEKEASLAKEHNMANVIALKEDETDYKKIIDAFINTENSKEERHVRRVNKIMNIENM